MSGFDWPEDEPHCDHKGRGERTVFNHGDPWVLCECGHKLRDLIKCDYCREEAVYFNGCGDEDDNFACDDHQWNLCCPWEIR